MTPLHSIRYNSPIGLKVRLAAFVGTINNIIPSLYGLEVEPDVSSDAYCKCTRDTDSLLRSSCTCLPGGFTAGHDQPVVLYGIGSAEQGRQRNLGKNVRMWIRLHRVFWWNGFAADAFTELGTFTVLGPTVDVLLVRGTTKAPFTE